MNPLPTLYDVLGVERTADAGSVRRAYRKLARKHHPDVNPDPSSHDLMAQINHAFETLSDPERKREYDSVLRGGVAEVRFKYTPKKPVQVRLIKRFRAHKTPIYAVAFSPVKGQLVTGAFDNEIIWWDIDNMAPMRKTSVEGGVITALRPLKNGSLIAAGSTENLLSIWRIEENSVEATRVNKDDWFSCVALTLDGQTIGSGSVKHRVCIATEKRSMFKMGHEDSVTAVAWSPDNNILATGSADNTVKLWRRTDGTLLRTIKAIRSTVTAIAFSPDGKFIAIAAVDLSIRVFSLEDGMLQKMMFGHTRPVETIAFHPNSWLFASGGRDGAVKLWNADKGLGQLHIDASHLAVSTIAFSPDGGLLAAAGLDKHVRIWEIGIKS